MIYRVSNVDAFRYWRDWDYDDPETEAAKLQGLIAGIRGCGEETEAMRKGTAFHKALEIALSGTSWDRVKSGEYTFIFNGDYSIEVASIRELRQSKTYMVDGKPITISGQVDAIEGLRIDDHKTTKKFDAEKYVDGYQWRLYLDIFGCDHFRWNVFECKEVEPFVYEVFGQHTLEQYRYPTLADDCQNMVEQFARFVREHVEVR